MTGLTHTLRTFFAHFASSPILRSVFVFFIVFIGIFALHETAYAQDGCNFIAEGGDLGKCLINVSGKVVASLLFLFLQVLNVVLGWVGGLFNWVMLTTVFQFSYYFANSEGMLLAWGILRDFANILLLFGFLYIGIQTILQINNFSVGKALPTLIIFAILLNFSLFIAEAMVDVSNAIGSTFYSQAASVDCRNPANADACENEGIAAHIFSAAGVTKLMETNAGLNQVWDSNNGVLALVVVGGVLMLVIATIGALAAGAFIFISRAIMLMFLLITSPVGLAGMAVPQLQKWSDKWWSTFLENIIFAPVFVLLILVSLKILDGVKGSFVGPDESMLTILSGQGGNPGALLIFFTLVVGFMIGSLLFAKESGVVGAKAVAGGALKIVGNTIGGAAGFAAFGVPAYAGRRILGGTAERASRFLRRSGLSTVPILGTAATKIADYGAKASFDVRGTGILDERLGKVGGISKATAEGARGVAAAKATEKAKASVEVEKARKRWVAEREEKWGAIQRDMEKKGASDTEIADRKKTWEGETRRKFISSDPQRMQRLETLETNEASAEMDQRNAATAIANARAAGQQVTRQMTAALTEATTRLTDAQKNIKALTETGEFATKYADRLADFARSLAGYVYDVQGIREASVNIRRDLAKTPQARLASDLEKLLTEAAQRP